MAQGWTVMDWVWITWACVTCPASYFEFDNVHDGIYPLEEVCWSGWSMTLNCEVWACPALGQCDWLWSMELRRPWMEDQSVEWDDPWRCPGGVRYEDLGQAIITARLPADIDQLDISPEPLASADELLWSSISGLSRAFLQRAKKLHSDLLLSGWPSTMLLHHSLTHKCKRIPEGGRSIWRHGRSLMVSELSMILWFSSLR